MYQALYRKYRAKKFEDVYGQDDIVTILKNSLKEQKNSHAYIFSGPRGTGKTTLSRIIAKAVNCTNLNNGDPCDECSSCIQINNNDAVDIIEIDAASNNGVDEIREINNKVNLMPNSLKYKIYIIDEVHMLTVGAFNALLKTLEEPPEHVIFILATTELNKVPVTVLSRCQCFLLKKIEVDTIVDRLRKICIVENIDIDENVLTKIAQSADGALRDALSSLDQITSFVAKNERVSIDIYNKVNGVLSDIEIELFVNAINDNDTSSILNMLSNMEKNGNDLIKIVNNVVLYLHKSILSHYSGNKKLIDVAASIKLANFLNLFIPELKTSFNPKIYLELKLLSYIYESPDKSIANESIKTNETKNNSKTNSKNEVVDSSVMVTKEDVASDKNYFPGNNLVTNSGDESNEDNKNYFPGNNFVISDELKKIRINNTFCDANKEALAILKDDIDNLHSEKMENGNIISLLLDSTIRVASETYAILSYRFESQVSIADQRLNEIEKLLNDLLNLDMRLVFITDDEWELTKNEYIVNMKNKVVYNYIEEPDKILLNNAQEDLNLSEAEILFGDMVEIEN